MRISPKDYTYLTVSNVGGGVHVARQGPGSPHAQVIATATHETHAVDIARALTAAAEADRAPVTSHVRKFLDLSTNHLPEVIMNGLNGYDGVVAHPNENGALMWVPDDPEEVEYVEKGVPFEVLTIWRFASA